MTVEAPDLWADGKTTNLELRFPGDGWVEFFSDGHLIGFDRFKPGKDITISTFSQDAAGNETRVPLWKGKMGQPSRSQGLGAMTILTRQYLGFGLVEILWLLALLIFACVGSCVSHR